MVGGGGRECVAEVSTLGEEARLSKGFGSLPEWSTLGWEAGAFMYSPTLGRDAPALSGSPHPPPLSLWLSGQVRWAHSRACPGAHVPALSDHQHRPSPGNPGTGALSLPDLSGETESHSVGCCPPPKTSIQEATDWCPPGPRLPLHPARNPLCQAPSQMEMFRSRSHKYKSKKKNN